MEVIQNITRQQIIDILRQDGYTNVQELREDSIVVKINGFFYFLSLENESVLKALYLISDTTISYEAANSWNEERSLSRALQVDENVVLDAALFMASGVHKENIIDFFSVFVRLCIEFNEYVNENKVIQFCNPDDDYWDDDIP